MAAQARDIDHRADQLRRHVTERRQLDPPAEQVELRSPQRQREECQANDGEADPDIARQIVRQRDLVIEQAGMQQHRRRDLQDERHADGPGEGGLHLRHLGEAGAEHGIEPVAQAGADRDREAAGMSDRLGHEAAEQRDRKGERPGRRS